MPDKSLRHTRRDSHHPQKPAPTAAQPISLLALYNLGTPHTIPSPRRPLFTSISLYPVPAMSSTALFRIATRSVRPSTFFKTSYSVRSPVQSLAGASMPVALGFAGNFSTTSKRFSAGHEEETYEEFSARYAAAPIEPRGCYRGKAEHRGWNLG